MAQDRLQRVHDAMAARVERGEMPGIVWLVAQRDGEPYVDAIGNFAFDDPRPMQRSTLFRIASLTKPVIAAATLILAEEGTLSLDEPVDRFIPELANRRVLQRIDGPLD